MCAALLISRSAISHHEDDTVWAPGWSIFVLLLRLFICLSLSFYQLAVFSSGTAAGLRHPTSVQAGDPQNPSSHHPALLPLQDHMGLGHPHPHLLHGHHGALQRLLQDEAEQRDVAGGGQHRGCHLPGGHRFELPHHVRWTRRGGHLRPQADPDELPEDVVCYWPAVLPAVRRHQRLWECRWGECSGFVFVLAHSWLSWSRLKWICNLF